MHFRLVSLRLLICQASVALGLHHAVAADNSRSDSVDILHTSIFLDVTDYAGKTLKGHCTLRFQAKVPLQQLDLDLLRLKVDSVKQQGVLLSFNYADSLTLHISLLAPLNVGDTASVTVYYGGKPKQDSGGWGGWYWSGDLAFNIGVALNEVPHTFGRSWFPCFDNFVERSTYSLAVRTAGNKMALCGGTLQKVETAPDGTTTWHYQLDEAIPSYLISVAVHQFAPVYDTYVSVTGDTIPIVLGAVATDTTKLKNSFKNLKATLQAYEQLWGPYRWPRVGYVLTTVGAMEHVTNIAYPAFLVNGQTTYEHIMAHELSHHWFGNLTTCRTDADMWLNEGWAVFNEWIFFEQLYGRQRYDSEMKNTLERCVRYLHTPLSDGAAFALNQVPPSHTYGETVYLKGALVAHTLRGYLGDSLFFSCMRQFMDSYAFLDVSSEDLEAFLTTCSGKDLSSFFANWVYAPGWTAFWVDSVSVQPVSPPGYEVVVFVKQRTRLAPARYHQVPLTLTFYLADGSQQRQTVLAQGECMQFPFFFTAAPKLVTLDEDDWIADAVTAEQKLIGNAGVHNLVLAKMNVTVTNWTDTALLRVEHVYAAPDPFRHPPKGLYLSRERFWRVDGLWDSNFQASATISYQGAAMNNGYLDVDLISQPEDSLVVVYRTSAAADWQIEPNVTQNTLGSLTDKRGNFIIHQLRRGQYALAIRHAARADSVTALSDSCQLVTAPSLSDARSVLLFPNPANDHFRLVVPHNGWLDITDALGRIVFRQPVAAGTTYISCAGWPAALYAGRLRLESGQQLILRLVVN
ncbi:MAG: M1 family metallopeptidase [Chitinophagales bacterium]|nr:M1 family aminopeptidase [Chitinophagales bacterium]MDW8393525.1 M1 family metallopeptidase [Chitinophagales bacterium]